MRKIMYHIPVLVRLCIVSMLFLSPPTLADLDTSSEATWVRQMQTMLFRVANDVVVYRGLAGDESALTEAMKNLESAELLLLDSPAQDTSPLQGHWTQFRSFVEQELMGDEAVVGLGWEFVVSLTETTRGTNGALEALLGSQSQSNDLQQQLLENSVILQYMLVRYSARAYLMPLRADSSAGAYEKDLDVLAQNLTDSLAQASESAEGPSKKKLKHIRKLWSFIEPRFVQYNEELAPIVVRRVGTKLVNELQQLSVSVSG